MKRWRVRKAAVRTVVEEGDYLHSRGMSADQLSYADMGTDLYANILVTFVQCKLACVEKYSCAGDQNKTYYNQLHFTQTYFL